MFHTEKTKVIQDQEDVFARIKEHLKPIRNLMTDQLHKNKSLKKIDGVEIVSENEQERIEIEQNYGDLFIDEKFLLSQLQKVESKLSLKTIGTINSTRNLGYRYMTEEQLVKAIKRLEVQDSEESERDENATPLGRLDSKETTDEEKILLIRNKCNAQQLKEYLQDLLNKEQKAK